MNDMKCKRNEHEDVSQIYRTFSESRRPCTDLANQKGCSFPPAMPLLIDAFEDAERKLT